MCLVMGQPAIVVKSDPIKPPRNEKKAPRSSQRYALYTIQPVSVTYVRPLHNCKSLTPIFNTLLTVK